MAVMIAGEGIGRQFSDGNTNYVNPSGDLQRSSTESRYTFLSFAAYTITSLYVRIISNTLNNTTYIRVRKNYGPTAISVTIPTGATGVFTDAVNSESLAIGDTFDYGVDTVLSTAGDIYISIISILATPTGSTLHMIGSITSTSYTVAFNQTRFVAISSQCGTNASEVYSQYRIRNNCNFSGIYVNVLINSLNGIATARLRVNSGDSALSISIPAGATGNFSNSNPAAINSGDLVSLALSGGGTAGDIRIVKWELAFDTPGRYLITGSALGINLTVTKYWIMEQGLNAGLEADCSLDPRTSFTARQLFVRSTYVATAGTTYFRINGWDSSLQVASVGSGEAENLVNTEPVISGDIIMWKTVESIANWGGNYLGLYAGGEDGGIKGESNAGKLIAAGII